MTARIVLAEATAADYPELAGTRYEIEMTDPRVSTAVRNENRGPGWERAAVIAGRALRAASPHAYEPVTDAGGMVSPRCKCGQLEHSGYVRPWLGTELYERHVLAWLAERRTPEPYNPDGSI